MANQGSFLSISPSGSDNHWKIAGVTSPVLILSASQDQRGHASIFNDAIGSLYITFGPGGVSNLSVTGTYDIKITSASYYELPRQPVYQGEIWGIWDASGGWARVLQTGIGK